MKSERDQKTHTRASISDHVIPPSPESKPFLNEDLLLIVDNNDYEAQ